MLETKQFNKIKDSLVPKLSPGEVAIYVCERNTVVGGVAKFPTVYMPSQDTIQNPDSEVGGVVDIAYIIQDAPDGKAPIFGDIIFEPTDKGIITLMYGKSRDARLYAFMEMTDFNGSKEGRDESKPIYFRRRRVGQASEDKFASATRDAEALAFARDTDIDELRDMLVGRGKNAAKIMPDHDLRSLALDEARKKPFVEPRVSLKAVSSSVTSKKGHDILNIGRISEMFDAEVLKWSVADKCIINTETGTFYEVPGLAQTDKSDVKRHKLLEACIADERLGELMVGEIRGALNI